MIRLFYGWLMWLIQPLLRRKLKRRGVQEPGYLMAIEERFGHYPDPPTPPDGHTVWIHAVSLGETRAAAGLIAYLRERLPGMRVLLTHGTATGREEGAKLLRPGDLQTWQPWDTPGAVNRFLTHFKPRLGILMETEIWPQLVAGCQRLNVPLVLVNARMSAKSQQRMRRLAWLSRPALGGLTAAWTQTEADAQRLRQLGAPVQGVLGNLKFDAAPQATLLAMGQLWRRQVPRPVVMLASSREGEEAALLARLTASTLASQATAVQWLIVPRHPQRFNEVAALIEAQGFEVSRRSHWPDGAPAPAPALTGTRPVIWLGDSLGDMALYYGLADVALLGGSFEPLGGQNLIEAAACACPMVMGPHTFNFAEAADWAEVAGAARRVASLSQAVEVALALVSNSVERARMVHAAAEFSSAHRGALEKTGAAVLALLGQQTVDRL